MPQRLAMRARIVLGSAAGESVRGLARRLGVTQSTVCLSRRRYQTEGLAGHGASRLVEVRAAAAPGRNLQVQH